MVVANPSLHVLALNHKFDDILKNLQQNDDDNSLSSLDWIDQQGNNLLHILCRQNHLPSRLINVVIKRRPAMVGQRNCASWTPLHLAFRSQLKSRRHRHGKKSRRSSDDNNDDDDEKFLLLQLIQACPRAVSIPRESCFIIRRGCGETPFHVACEAQVEIEILEAMLKIDPTLAVTKLNTAGINELLLVVDEKKLLYQHANLILLTAWAGKVITSSSSEQTTTTKFLLHAAVVCFQCIPRDYFMKILKECEPSATIVKDSQGNTPLHLAAMSKPTRGGGAAAPPPPPPAQLQFLLNTLLDTDSRAAYERNQEGRYPLHCALDNPHIVWITSIPHFGSTTCISRALWGCSSTSDSSTDTSQEASSSSSRQQQQLLLLCIRDVITGLYPFQLSAMHAHRSRLHLTTTFEMLRAAPEVVGY